MRAGYRIRPATVEDAAVIAVHRIAMFRDMGILDEAGAPVLEAESRACVRDLLASGEYAGWLAEKEGAVVAGAGVLLRRLLPRAESPRGGREAYILNVYTDPAHRRSGLARRLTELIVAWCRVQEIRRIVLHASDQGRPLYESMGFVANNEMILAMVAETEGL